jgi:hypothetical protein
VFTRMKAARHEGITILYFWGPDARREAAAAASSIEEYGPVESPRRTVDFARSHSFSAPEHYGASVVTEYRHPDEYDQGIAMEAVYTVRTNAPAELLATLLLAPGETFAGHAERASCYEREAAR